MLYQEIDFLMNPIKLTFARLVSERIWRYIEKDPVPRFRNVIKWAKWFDIKNLHNAHINAAEKALSSPGSNWGSLITDLITQVDRNIMRKILNNLFINSGLLSYSQREKIRIKNQVNLPWVILMDPTSKCNLKCKGCWAAD
jgi:hypothetical protein